MHISCPHCHNPIELVTLPDLGEVLCPSCGSTFHVADSELGTTATLTQTSSVTYFGRFVLQEILGRGSFGTVYRARDLQLDREVAVKIPRAGNLAGEGELARFLREARASARLKHPSIVAVHEVGEHEGRPYIVSELVQGVNLAEWLTGRKPTFRESAALMAEAAEALDLAHKQGVVHRDVKPSNMMIDSEGRLHIMDFGLAKRDAGEITMTLDGTLLGTPAYMAPEQVEKAHLADARSDVYSLGVVLYHLLTGELPFRGTIRMLIHQVRYDEPRPPRKLNDRIPRDLETICLKAMAKEPSRRYVTAQNLAADLRHWLNGEPILARPVGAIERGVRWCRRKPALAGSLGTVVLALVAVAVLAVLYADQEAQVARQQTRIAKAEAESKRRITLLADDLKVSKAASDRRLAILNFERGEASFQKEQIGPGLLWMVESWRSAVAAGDPYMQHAARLNLSAWRYHNASLKAIFSHDGEVRRIAFSSDGKSILTGSFDNTARLWDALTGEPIGELLKHQGPVPALAFSPDGKTVLTGSADMTARLWDAATGKPIGSPLQHQGSVVSVAFSPDGKTVLTGSFDNTARLWDAATGKPVGSPLQHQGQVRGIAFSPDGKTVLTGSADSKARLWDSVTGKPIGIPLEHDGAILSVAFSPDGKTVLTRSIDFTRSQVRFWASSTGKPLGKPLPIHLQDAITFVSDCHDGKTFVTGSCDGKARLWDAASGNLFGMPMTHPGAILSVAFSPDGKAVLTGCADGATRLWDAATGSPVSTTLSHQGAITSVAFSPDGKTFLTGSADSTARHWDTATGKSTGKPLPFQGMLTAVYYSPDGKTVVIVRVDGLAFLWDAAFGKLIGTPKKYQAIADPLAFSPDGKTVLTGSLTDGTARLWDALTGKPIGELLKHQGPVPALAFSPDGKTVLTGSADMTARLWDAATGRPVSTTLSHQSSVETVAFSPDGKTVLTGSYRLAKLWDALTGKPVGEPLRHQGLVIAAAFSPDGKTVLTGSSDGKAQHWDLATRKPIGMPLEHQGPVPALAFSPDGKTVLTGSSDGKAQHWDLATRKPIGMPLEHQSSVWSLAFSPDGKTILTRSQDSARLWDVAEELPDDLPRMAAWVGVLTGLELDDLGQVHVLDNASWLKRRERLEQLGGPPETKTGVR